MYVYRRRVGTAANVKDNVQSPITMDLIKASYDSDKQRSNYA